MFGSTEVRSVWPEDMTTLHRVEYQGGGDVILQKFETTYHSDGRTYTREIKRGFMGIENAVEVEALLRRTLFASGQ